MFFILQPTLKKKNEGINKLQSVSKFSFALTFYKLYRKCYSERKSCGT